MNNLLSYNQLYELNLNTFISVSLSKVKLVKLGINSNGIEEICRLETLIRKGNVHNFPSVHVCVNKEL